MGLEPRGLTARALELILLTHDMDNTEFELASTAAHFLRRPMNMMPNDFVRKVVKHLNGRWNWFHLDEVARLEESYGVRSTLFIRAEPNTYSLDSPLSDILRALHARGWEVGLHASIGSARDANLLRSEKSRLESALQDRVRGVRHHYLARSADTWKLQLAEKFEYDSSFGSSETITLEQPFSPARGFWIFPVNMMDSMEYLKYAPLLQVLKRVRRALEQVDRERLVFTVDFHQEWMAFEQEKSVYRYILKFAEKEGLQIGPIWQTAMMGA